MLLGNDGRMGNAMGVFSWNGIFCERLRVAL